MQHSLSSFQIHHEKEHARHTHTGRARRFGLEAPLYPLGRKDMEAIGIEPTTPCLQSRCSPS
jgi:hypothetical protein